MESVDLDLGLHSEILRRVILKEYPHRLDDFIRSFDKNQIECKKWLVEELIKTRRLDDRKNLKVTIFGSWYGNIIVPFLIKNISNIREVELIDMDSEAIAISRKIHSKSYCETQIKYTIIDINFFDFSDYYTNILINTSCEHMAPMNNFHFRNEEDIIFCLQSNNMFDLREHVNCVNSENELLEQSDIFNPFFAGKKKFVGQKGKEYERYLIIGRRV